MKSSSYPRWWVFADGWHWQEGVGKELWPRERDFVDWLIANLDEFSDVVGMRLEFNGREVRVGKHWLAEDDINGRRFWVGGGRLDLDLCNEHGQRVIVEAQLGNTDHSHLGQLVSYACQADAQFAVWVIASADADSDDPLSPDHLAALAELNEIYAERRRFMVVHVTVKTRRHLTQNFDDERLLPSLRQVNLARMAYVMPNSPPRR